MQLRVIRDCFTGDRFYHRGDILTRPDGADFSTRNFELYSGGPVLVKSDEAATLREVGIKAGTGKFDDEAETLAGGSVDKTELSPVPDVGDAGTPSLTESPKEKSTKPKPKKKPGPKKKKK
jgi:hypothetical protein